MELVTQESARPTRKMQYVAVVGVLSYILTQIAARFLGADIPEDVAMGIPVAAGTLAGYLVRERASP